MLVQDLKYLIERREALQAGTFTHPPSDWAEFQNRLGRWSELTLMIDEIEEALDQEKKREIQG